MGKELYVGSLSYDTTERDLEKLFSVSGRVTSIHLITDPVTGEFKGCGYVRMSTEAEAKDAIASLDGALLIDRTITVSEARPQKQLHPGGKGRPGPGAGARGAAAKGGFAKPGPARGGSPKPAGGPTGGFKAGGAARPGSAKAGSPKPAGRPGSSKTGKR